MPSTTVDYDSSLALRAFLEAEGLAMSKRLGQNFLVNRDARERILASALKAAGLEAAGPTGSATPAGGALPAGSPPARPPRVWEIGPGIGSMTELALDAGLDLTVFELDHGFARILPRLFGERPNFRLVEGDFLKTWKTELADRGRPDLIFGNLPYNIANAIVADLIEDCAELGVAQPPMAFTVQKEAAIRMAAKPGVKDYSSFSVLCTSSCKVTLAFDLSASSFWPHPRVTSTLVLLRPKPKPIGATDRKGFSAFCRSVFSSRRKTIKNNLKAAGYSEADVKAVAEAQGLSPELRGEVLEPAQLEKFWLALRELRGAGQAAGLANAGPEAL
jgi:16S rRNA (adenine1518-N6/adenine1519-N6)-dimethyltransferase